MHSELAKNNSTTSDKTFINDNSKEISLSDEFGNFSIFSENLKITQAHVDSATSEDE